MKKTPPKPKKKPVPKAKAKPRPRFGVIKVPKGARVLDSAAVWGPNE